ARKFSARRLTKSPSLDAIQKYWEDVMSEDSHFQLYTQSNVAENSRYTIKGTPGFFYENPYFLRMIPLFVKIASQVRQFFGLLLNLPIGIKFCTCNFPFAHTKDLNLFTVQFHSTPLLHDLLGFEDNKDSVVCEAKTVDYSLLQHPFAV
ncbi:hypothetical protein HHI36_009680, partial [Cryptolaemus montrouzieri]